MMETDCTTEYKAGQIAVSSEMIATCFMIEMRELANATALPLFSNIWKGFAGYSGYIRKRSRQVGNVYRPIMDASNGSRIIDVETRAPEIINAFAIAHIAACCELLQGNRIGGDKLNPSGIQQYANNYLNQLQNASEMAAQNLIRRIHIMDAVRTMHLLRSLGLVTRPDNNLYQLALGAGSGEKDIFSLHTWPAITTENFQGNNFYKFTVNRGQVAQIVLSDSDPQRKDAYYSLNQQYGPQVLACNEETSLVLDSFNKNNFRKRNLITAIRLDHRMIPDPEKFLASLIMCLDEQCDMIFSIGSGDNPDDLAGRISVLAELFHLLEKAMMRPVLFKFHKSGSIIEQYESLQFGNPLTSTFQILYCKLNKKALIKKFRK